MLVSPSKTRLSVDTKTLVGVRARYVQPYEDYVLGGGVSVLDAAVDRIERAGDGPLTVHLRRTDGGADLAVEVDDVISATGFVTPLVDLPDLGVQTFGASRLPVQTPWWESASVPGIFFAGTIGQGAKGLQKHGVPANSGAVHGARYNARALAGHIAAERFGIEPERPHLAPDAVAGFVATELAEAPELFHQRGYLARVVTADPDGGVRDEGVLPLTSFLDGGGRTRSPRPSRPTAPAPSTRCSTRASTASWSSRSSSPIRSCATTRSMPGARSRTWWGGSSGADGANRRSRQTRAASRDNRSAAASERLGALGEGEAELGPTELRSREERGAGHGRHARVRG